MVFTIIFVHAQKNWCDLNNSNVSKLKVEKVLNPPQMPVSIKRRIVDGYSILSFTIHKVIPKTIQLLTLADNVAKGKARVVLWKMIPRK